MTQQSFIGRSKFGGSSLTLAAMSLGGGIALSAILAGLFYTFGPFERSTLFMAIYMIITVPVCTAIFWAILVDRQTITGAVANPEKSIESLWYDKAASDTFHAILIFGGIAGFIAAFTTIQVSVSLATTVLLLFTSIVFAASYAIRKHRDS